MSMIQGFLVGIDAKHAKITLDNIKLLLYNNIFAMCGQIDETLYQSSKKQCYNVGVATVWTL